MPIADEPAEPVELTDADKADLAAMAQFAREEAGYASEQSTKPQTLGVALNDSPAGLLAWIVEKFRAWSDCDGQPENVFTRDQLITNVMLYWVTGTSASSARLYWEHQHRGSVEGAPEYVGSSHRHRALPQGSGALPALVGRTALQRHALGRHAARRPLRRDGATRAVRRRRSRVLPDGALTSSSRLSNICVTSRDEAMPTRRMPSSSTPSPTTSSTTPPRPTAGCVTRRRSGSARSTASTRSRVSPTCWPRTATGRASRARTASSCSRSRRTRRRSRATGRSS